MKPVPFDYIAPATVEHALDALAQLGLEARPLAGGQSLVPMLALRLARPKLLVDLNRIPGLSGIREEGGEIRIGAMTRQAELLASPLVARRLPLLSKALAEVGHAPTRNRGTIGGSLAHADPAAELPSVMLAEDARFVIRSRRGERIVAASDFFRGVFETAIGAGELLTEIRIVAETRAGTGFCEVARRQGDFAVVLAATKLALDGLGRCSWARVVLGAVGPAPVRCRDIEAELQGLPPDEDAIAKSIRALPLKVIELEGPTASRHYRETVAPVVLKRALIAASASARELAQ